MNSTQRIALIASGAILGFQAIEALMCLVHPLPASVGYAVPILIFMAVGFFLARTTPGHSVKSTLAPAAFVGLTFGSIGYAVCELISTGKLTNKDGLGFWLFTWTLDMIVAYLFGILGLLIGRFTIPKLPSDTSQ
ncbi:hypothetical protein [Granulicella rosea]|uniref:hypothetical protein n=1 Tax=Granulicella rosea TaxID=474952 RepID=UPI00115CB803|nr:hypothetical protein [Granulicella rosea]